MDGIRGREKRLRVNFVFRNSGGKEGKDKKRGVKRGRGKRRKQVLLLSLSLSLCQRDGDGGGEGEREREKGKGRGRGEGEKLRRIDLSAVVDK